nr:hypothetical protein JG3_0190 [uncultured bacterium]
MKKNVLFLTAFFLFAVFFLLNAPAQTSSPFLDPAYKVFVQEYWKSGAPNYFIANLNDENIQLVLRVVTAADIQNGTDAAAPILVQWPINAGAIAHFYAGDINTGASDDQLIAFYKGNKLIGTMLGPWSHQPEASENTDGISSYYSLNGLDGYSPKIWVSREKLNFSSGQDIGINLFMLDRCGRISFPKHKLRDNPLQELFVTGASSDTLSITETDDEIVLDARDPAARVPVHKARLNFMAPNVSQPTMVCIAGWWQPGLSPSGRDRRIIRALHIKP